MKYTDLEKEDNVQEVNEGESTMSTSEIMTVASSIALLDQQISSLKDAKKKLADKLMPAMKSNGIKEIPVPDYGRSIEIKKDTSKRATKAAIVAKWPKAGQKFWDELPSRNEEYLSIRKHKNGEEKS